MALGNRVKTLRKRLKLTLEQLSERSGVDLGTIAALENRDSIRSKFAPQLASALGVSLENLLGVTEAPDTSSQSAHCREWPFSHIEVARILALSPEDRAEVEADLLYSLEKIERRSTKKSKTTKRAAA